MKHTIHLIQRQGLTRCGYELPYQPGIDMTEQLSDVNCERSLRFHCVGSS